MQNDAIRRGQIYDAIDIANYIINHMHGTRRLISNLTLQQVLYFVQAQFLITYGEPCFSEPILAWDSGPIVKSVYDEYKFYGTGSIPSVHEKPMRTQIHPEDAMLINEIVNLCVKHSATTLLNFIHGQMPWKQGRIRPNNQITNEDLYKFFSE